MEAVLRLISEVLPLRLSMLSESEIRIFSIVYELSEDGEKLYFDNPLGEPCEAVEDEAINTFLDMLLKIFKLCEERS